MKGAIYHGIENVSVEELEMPECGDYDVILKNVKGSICGTDVGAYYHGGDDAGIYPENQFGHEMSSIVYQVGSKVDPSIKKVCAFSLIHVFQKDLIVVYHLYLYVMNVGHFHNTFKFKMQNLIIIFLNYQKMFLSMKLLLLNHFQ